MRHNLKTHNFLLKKDKLFETKHFFLMWLGYLQSTLFTLDNNDLSFEVILKFQDTSSVKFKKTMKL